MSATYLEAVAQTTAGPKLTPMGSEHGRLKALCLQQFQPTLKLRKRTEDESKALVMILNHEIEVPRVPAFLTQSMGPGELACFEDLFMALENPIYAHLAPGQRFFDNMSKRSLLAQIYVGEEAAPLQKQQLTDFKNEFSRITLDMETRVVKVTFKGKQTAARWTGWQMPLAGRSLLLIDYESIRERAQATNELVRLDYYSFEVELHKGSLTSRDMYWLMTKMLGLTVQAMAHVSSEATGIKEQQWNVRVQAGACPEVLRNVGNSPNTPEQLEGSVPSTKGHSNRDYVAGGQPKTIKQLEALLRKEGSKLQHETPEPINKSPTKAVRLRSPRKGDQRRDIERLSLPAEWGQSLTTDSAEDVQVVNMQVDSEEEKATEPFDFRIREEERGEDTDAAMPDRIDRPAEVMKEEVDEAKEPGREMTSQFGEAFRSTRVKQRQEKAEQKLRPRGRSPTAKVRGKHVERKKQQAEFSLHSKELQTKIDLSREVAHRVTRGSGRAAARNMGGVLPRSRGTVSLSPRRTGNERRGQKRELEVEEDVDIEPNSSGTQGKARSISPKRRSTDSTPEGSKVITQQFIHQFMVAVTGRRGSEVMPLTSAGKDSTDTEDSKAPTAKTLDPNLVGAPATEAGQGTTPAETAGCSIMAVTPPTDHGAPLSDWLAVLRGTISDVAANGHCGWLAFYAALYDVTEGLLQPSPEVANRTNVLKRHVLNAMIANLVDELRLHPEELAMELRASGCHADEGASHHERVCALVNHYVAQRNKSVKGAVPMHYWIRPTHLKAMAMYARETIYVLDVHEDGIARMQAYAYHEEKLTAAEVVETGTVCPVRTEHALALLGDLVDAGIRPPVLVLRWSAMGNHFQAVTYDEAEHRIYSDNLVILSEKRNSILGQHGWQELDVIAYDEDKTARAATTALTAIRKAANYNRPKLTCAATTGTTIGGTPTRDTEIDTEADSEVGGPKAARPIPMAQETSGGDNDSRQCKVTESEDVEGAVGTVTVGDGGLADDGIDNSAARPRHETHKQGPNPN